MTNLNIVTKALSILLLTKRVKLWNRYALSNLKWVGTSKILKTGAKTCLFWLKMMKCGKNSKTFGIWLKKKLGIKFHSEPIYEQKYLKAKVREFDGAIKTNFLGNDTPKENMHYSCIACTTIDSVMRMDKKIILKFI